MPIPSVKKHQLVMFVVSPHVAREETQQHADCVFLGEAEGRMEQVFTDFKNR